MAKRACVGTVFYQQISGTYTAVAQVKDVSLDDVGGNSIDVASLDSPQDSNDVPWKDKIWDGFGDPGSGSASLFGDPSLTGHQNLLLSNFAATNWKTVYANTGGAYDLWASSSTKLSRKVSVGQALMFDLKTENSGPVTQF